MTYVVKRTMRLINGKLDELMSKKGCDASNMFDEEVLPTEQEYSDDEDEKEAKRLKKLSNKRKHGQKDSGSSDSEEEGQIDDGELPARGRGERGGRG